MTLQDFFTEYPETAIAFSGGADSAYLLYAAKKYGKRTRAYYVKTEFQPRFELEDGKRLAETLEAELSVLEEKVLMEPDIRSNPKDRCYNCKKRLFQRILEAAEKDGFTVLLDGTNASDDSGDRPGMRALAELSVLSPLRECGLTKAQIRSLSREAGLFTWNKPAYACLATRISAGQEITAENLAVTEAAESYLASLGFTDFRIRWQDGHGRIQLQEEQTEFLLARRGEILEELKKYYKTVSLDLEVRR